MRPGSRAAPPKRNALTAKISPEILGQSPSEKVAFFDFLSKKFSKFFRQKVEKFHFSLGPAILRSVGRPQRFYAPYACQA